MVDGHQENMEGAGEAKGPPPHPPIPPEASTPPQVLSACPGSLVSSNNLAPAVISTPPHTPQESLNPSSDLDNVETDALPIPSAPTLPPSPALERPPVPSAPVVEDEDVVGTQNTPHPHNNPQPPNYNDSCQGDDTTDGDFIRGSDSAGLPPYTPDMAPPKARRGQRASTGTPSGEDATQNVPQRPRSIRTGINLVRVARRLLVFLSKVDRHGGLYRGELVERAIRRYEECWLPLARRVGRCYRGCLPPLDVHWVWLVHMLSPLHYRRDCEAIVGCVVPHRLMTEAAAEVARARGKRLWEKVYPEEPWEVEKSTRTAAATTTTTAATTNGSMTTDGIDTVDGASIGTSVVTATGTTDVITPPTASATITTTAIINTPPGTATSADSDAATTTATTTSTTAASTSTDITNVTAATNSTANVTTPATDASTSQISYDLRSAVERQSAFYYQVSLPHFREKGFLRQSERRYKQFLALKKANPTQFLVPCYDIDLLWHAHMVHPDVYWLVTEALLGQVLSHDDSVNDRTPGSRLITSDQNTRALWGRTFHNTFRRDGAMYRGDAPSSYLSQVPEKVQDSAHSSIYHCQVLKLAIKGRAPDGPLKIKIKHEGRKVAELSVFREHKTETEHDVAALDATFCVQDQMLNEWMIVKMSPMTRFSRIKKFFGSGVFWSMEYFYELRDIVSQGIITKTFTDCGAIVEVTIRVVQMYTDKYVPLGILTGPFMPSFLEPTDLRVTQGISTQGHSSTSDLYLAEIATHRLVNEINKGRPSLLSVEVTHSRYLAMSSLRIFATSGTSENLVALAHTLDANTLPSPASLKCHDPLWQNYTLPMCDYSAGERAMIIKTFRGDWAVLVGSWKGLRAGIPGNRMRQGIPGSPGHLEVRFHCPPSAPAFIVSLPYERQLYSCSLRDLKIDLREGILKVNAGTEEWVENVALGLGLTVLHVLCQPRMAQDESEDTVDGLSKIPEPSMYPRRIPVEDMKLLGAMGFFCAAAPTNAACGRDRLQATVTTTCTLGMVGGNIAAGCGACGGCGGCGGGEYYEACLSAASHSGGWVKGIEADSGNDGAAGGDEAGGVDPFAYIFSMADCDGGGDGGDGGGDGGGCGGCGGCGG